MDKINEKLEYMMEKCPEKVMELAKHIYKQDPEIVERMLDYPEDAEHITNRRKYDELVEKLRWEDDNNGRGAKWSFEDIKKNSRIDFYNTDYTEFDYAYLVNALYAKCCKYIKDPSVYLKLAKCLLEDRDEETKIYRGHDYKSYEQKSRGAQSRYRDYSEPRSYYEEDRRGRRTRSEHMNDYEDRRYNDPFEDRRRVDNPQYNNDFFRQR
ncbi:MAG: hypothetical protein NC191_08935 [Muribaculaceae bacterium]|nr:hypothetical protein [Muribaculaceae bacterium]